MVRPHDQSSPDTLDYLLYKDAGHIVPDGVAATIAVGAQASAAAALGFLRDAAGGARVTAVASGNAAGVLATITFGTPYLATPKAVTLTARTAATAALGLYVSAISATAFTISCGVTTAASVVYDLSYVVVG